MCSICGLPNNIPCDCTEQPYCDQCNDESRCTDGMDAQCVIYHWKTDTPTKLVNMNLPNGSTVEHILEVIDGLIGDSFNIALIPEDTATVNLTASGAAGHNLKADVKVSGTAGNKITIASDGLLVPTDPNEFKVKVNGSDAPGFLINKIVGATDGCVSISATVQGGILQLMPTLNIICLFQLMQTSYLPEFCALVEKCKCFLNIENLIATFAPACPTGYTLNDANTLCVKVETTDATISNTIISACPQFRPEYSAYGALVYKNGFDTDGTGIGASLGADIGAGNVIGLSTANVWQSDNATGNNNGPLNRAGIWNCDYTGSGTEENPEILGFTVPINVPSTKTYYIGIAADNDFQVNVNGAIVVDSALSDGSYWTGGGGQASKFRFWHIYPITLTSGINYLSLFGKDYGIDAVLAAEIYDNSLAQLQAATLNASFVSNPSTFPYTSNHYGNLNLVFSTRCARQDGSTFSVGNATCPDSSWSLDTTGGDSLAAPCQGINNNTADWICKRTVTAPFSGFAVTLVWDRIPNALTYTVQSKASAAANDNTYADVTGSPVTNPTSGSTVSLTLTGLSSDELVFRVRANFEECSTEWTTISG